MVDLSQHKTLFSLKSRNRFPDWCAIPVRIFLITFVGTLLSFAVALLLAIPGTVLFASLRGLHPDLRMAYRHIALPIALLASVVIFIAATILEVRNYRQARTLKAIERIS